MPFYKIKNNKPLTLFYCIQMYILKMFPFCYFIRTYYLDEKKILSDNIC